MSAIHEVPVLKRGTHMDKMCKATGSSIVSLPQVGLAVIDLRTMHLRLMQLVETSRTYTNTM